MFYADCFNSIPEGIVNKKVCGCGITSYALENSSPIILCVPTVEIIRNKLSQYPNERRNEEILGIYEGKNKHSYQIESYLDKVEVPKILVTYDSLHYLIPYLNMFHLVIDEFSELLDCYSFRSNAINDIMNIIETKRYSKLSLVSATPINPAYLPSYLQNLPYTELQWDESLLTNVKVIPLQTTKPVNAVVNLIKKYKLGLIDNSNQAFFFVNSVNMISKILDQSDLLASEVHVVCSHTKENENKLGFYDISTTTDVNNNPRMFNFFTSTAFKGCDIYSESGMSYIVSNHKSITTLLTIDTDLYQIAGRIRTPHNPHRHTIYHIHNKNPLTLNQDEANTLNEERKKRTLSLLEVFSNSSEEGRKGLIELCMFNGTKDTYLRINQSTMTLSYDELKELLEKRIYETVIQAYQSGISLLKTYISNGYAVDNSFVDPDLTKGGFIQLFKAYEQNPNNHLILEENALIKEAVDKLGLGKCKALKYQKNKIMEELSFINNESLIKVRVYELTPKNKFLTSKDCKVLMNKIYKELKLNKKSKGSDILNYIHLQTEYKTVNGKRVKGYRIK